MAHTGGVIKETILDKIYRECGHWQYYPIELVEGYQKPVLTSTLEGSCIIEVGTDWLGDEGWAELVVLRIEGEIYFEKINRRLLVHHKNELFYIYTWKEWKEVQQPMVMSDPFPPITWTTTSGSSGGDWGSMTYYYPAFYDSYSSGGIISNVTA